MGKMRIDLCSYSGYKIYPGHGKRMVRVNGRVYNFLSHKCERSHLMKRNPREINWTVLYRRKHKKGQQEETVKKRTRHTEVHPCHHWCYSQRHHGQEEPEA